VAVGNAASSVGGVGGVDAGNKAMVLAMLWALVLAIQLLLVVLVLVQLLSYRRQTLPSRCQVVCVS
jgi:hypothetical protein